MKSGLLLNVVVEEGSAILQHLLHKKEFLLVGRQPLFILNLGFNVLDAVQGITLTVMGLARERFEKICMASALSGSSNEKLRTRLALIVDMHLPGTTSL